MNTKNISLVTALLISCFTLNACAYNKAEGDYGVSYNEILSPSTNIIGNTIAFEAYVFFDGRSLKLYPNIDSIHSVAGQEKSLMVAEPQWGKLKSFSGCLVMMRATLEYHPRNKKFFQITDIENPEPNGLLYHIAADRMKAKGIKGKPRCLGEALLELMATPK